MNDDAVSVAPDVYKVLFENDRVRVLEVRANPGETSPAHTHPDSVIHALSDATLVVTTQQGEARTERLRSLLVPPGGRRPRPTLLRMPDPEKFTSSGLS